MMMNTLRRLCVCLLLCSTSVAWGQTIDRAQPDVMLRQATDQLLQLARQARAYAPEDKPRYHREVADILDQAIDRDYFARGVMAVYASSRVYKTLQTPAEKTAFKARIKRFADVMETVLIGKYADALLSFEGERVDIELINSETLADGKATLVQTIYAPHNTTYTVQYSAQKQDDGLWLIVNVVVEGINMGSTFRTQFAEAMESNQGNIDYVVDNWATLMNPSAGKGAAQ